MGFLTRLLAGLLAASTLGAGLAGTAGAADTTGATGDAKGVVKLASDDTSGLPDHIVNGNFEYPVKSDMPVNDGNFWYISQNDGSYFANGTVLGKRYKLPEGFDKAKFAWHSTQTGDTYYPDLERADDVQVDYKADGTNHYSEISAAQSGATIYQDVATVPGVMYKWSLKHASEDASHVDSMQVTIGSPGKETAQDATRTTSNGRGDRTGVTSKTIATKGGQAEWETYTGVYIATSTVTRFTFKSAQGRDSTRGNFIDDVMFTKAYKLTYDKNSADASGQVPSNQRGKENTTQPAKNKTNGKIRLASDTSKLSDHLVNSDFEYLPDGGWKTVDAPSYMRNAYTSVDPNNGQYMRNAKHVDADLASWVDWPGFDQSKFAWKTDQKGGHDQGGLKDRAEAVELQQDSTDGNTYAEMVASETGRTIYQNLATIPGTLYKIRLKHASLCKDNVDQMQVVINGTPIEMTRVAANGKAGDKVGEKSTTIGTRVTNENRWHHSDQWETYEGYYVIPDGQTTTRFGFKAVNYLDPTKGNLLDDVTFARAYKLSYDKNSTDATGEVPSNQRGKENTVEPAESKTNGTVKTVADENVRYGSLANGDFSYPSFSDIQKNEQETHADLRTFLKSDDGTLWYNMSATDLSKYGKIGQIPGFDSSRFAWSSTENGSRVELQQDRNTKNTYAEIVAQQDNTSIYQNVSTGNGGVLYKIRLKHASRQSSHADRMQVLVGSDTDHATPVEMTRVTSNGHGDKVGGKSTIITTKVSNTDPRDHGAQWETYEGYYQVPEGQKNTVFMFKSLEGFKEYETLSGNNIGNLVDDIEFSRSYRLTYDANSSDASGQVPSDTTANTVKQAKARTTGTVRAVADRTASGLTVHDLKNGEIAPVQYGDFKFSTVNGFSADQVTNVNGFTVKTNWDPCEENQAYAGVLATMYQPNGNGANLILHHVGQWRDSSGTQRWLNARITVNGQNLGTLVYIPSTRKFVASYGKWDKHPSSRPYMDVTVDFLLDDGSTPQGLRGATGFTDIDGGTSGYNEGVELVSGFDGAYVRSDAHLARFGTNGWAGITDENKHDADAHGMKHYVGATFTGSSFRVRWSVASGQARQSGFQPVDSTIAYRLTYDKNAQDATGSIPSDTAADTIRPAKSETDGKVSDLVQRTTTHEDGSVTVKTIDTSTDVVSGCQVYYPAGQRITLATMAKDDDCWDSSMLTRPGHTQLGWNQDRNATQAQAEVTMVEGGMTVFAVWVGNPVLTYDTNKPSTWSGQMPSTPASVSVPYNTAAADGSGWRAGDTTKIRGYRFLGWYTAPQDNTGLYQWATPLTGNVTVYAHWQRLQANVVYNANGGTGSHPNTTGWQYSDVTVPGDVSKSFKHDGLYRFKHWNTQPNDQGTVYTDGSRIALQDKDITLYAIWVPYHENFVPTGGIGLPIAIAGGVLLLMFGIGSTVMLTRRMNGHGMPDDE